MDDLETSQSKRGVGSRILRGEDSVCPEEDQHDPLLQE